MKTNPLHIALMKTLHAFLYALIFLCGASSRTASAAIQVLSQPYLSDFEFFDNGLYYWGGLGSVSGCGPGEFGNAHTLGTLGYRGPKFADGGAAHPRLIGTGRTYWEGCGSPIPGGVTRDDTFIYYSDGQGMWRLPASLIPSVTTPAPTHLGNYIYADSPGAMMIRGNTLYFAASFNSPVSGPNGSLGRFQIYSLSLPITDPLAPVTTVAHGGSIPDLQPGRLKKMATMETKRYNPLTGGDVTVTLGIALGDNGTLFRYDLSTFFGTARNPRVLAYNVADFAIRRETRPVGLFGIETKDQLYAAVNDGPIIGSYNCSAAGRLNIINPDDGTQTQIWPRAGENYGRIQVTDVALDNNYIFINTRPVSLPGGLFGICSYGQEVIRSKLSPANTVFIGIGGVDPDYQGVELNGGHNLRSDGTWLYFTRNSAIYRIPNSAPPIQLDFGVVGLEAVQVIQDMNHSVRLIEGKRTVVRAYAREVTNTTGNAGWRPAGQLRGWLNGVELPGSPLNADTSPALLNTLNLAPHRSSTANNHLFELPSEWVRAGTLRLQFTVNPGGSIYESGGNPYGNNSTSPVDVTVVRVDRPAFVFAALKTTDAPNYWPWENSADFNKIIARATALLPIPSIDVRFTTEQVSDVEFIGDCGLFCHDPFDFSQNDDWNEALEELADYDNFDHPPPGASRGHFIGGIHPNAAALWGGLGNTPGTHLLAVMSATDNNNTFNTSWGGRTLAHEFGHNLGRQHVDQTRDSMNCGTNAPARPDPSYPFNSCTFGPTNVALSATPVGFDMISYAPVLPNQAGDLLSYAPVRWPSTWTYNAMLNALAPAPAFAAAGAPPSGPYLLLRGMLKLTTRTARLRPCYSLPEGVIAPEKIQESLRAAARQSHDYKVRQLDAAGTLLEEVALVIRDTDDGDNSTSLINQFLVKQPGVSQIQVTRGTTVLATLNASASAPVISGLNVVYDPNGPNLGVTISADDADGDLLRHTVQYSNDDGLSWRTLRINSTLAAFVADASRLPGGDACRVRVITTDGFNSTVATSEPFAVARRSPEVLAGGLKDGQRVPFGANVEVTVLAVDPEDGSLADESSTWTITGPSALTTTTGKFNTRQLAPGSYSATATATDADGNSSTATVTFQILPLAVNDAAAPALDGDVADSAYVSAAPVFFGGNGVARFSHSAGYLYASFTGMPYGEDNTFGAVGLRVDADGSGEATAQPGDRAFYVNENGTAWQLVGDGASLIAPATPEDGFKAVVSRGDGGWSAEFRIAEDLIGGWDHPARMSIELDGASCIEIFFGQICFPSVQQWPATAEVNNPSTWADVYFGIPPAPVNQPPAAITPAGVLADLGTKVYLSGAGSYDPDGDALSYQWTQIEGPSVALTGADTATPSFTMPAGDSAINLRFQLVVSDGALDSLPAETLVTGTAIAISPLPVVTPGISIQDGTANGQIFWPGRQGDQVVIQASTDLENWADVATGVVGNIPVVLFQDAEAGLYPHRFYRAAAAPSGIVENPGNALTLDGLISRVEVPHDSALNAFPLTISFWVKSADTDLLVRGLVSKYADGSLNGFGLFLYGGHVRGWYFANGGSYVWDGAQGLDGGFVADGQWHFVTLMIDEESGRLYVDGSLKASRAWTGRPGTPSTTQPLQFGRYDSYPTGLSGQMDDVAIWNRTFSEVELLDLKNFSPVGDEPGLIGLWHFDEEDGDGPTTADSSGQGHTGTLRDNATRSPSGAPIRQ